jgi:hypothetical protein
MSIVKYKGIYFDLAILIISFLLLFHLIYLRKSYYITYWSAILGLFVWGFWAFQKRHIQKSAFRRLIIMGVIIIITNLLYIFSICRQKIPLHNIHYWKCNTAYLILPSLLSVYGFYMIIRGVKVWKKYIKPS